MFFSDPFLFAISILDSAAILFIQIYFMLTLTDFESDFVNAQECCSKLNFWVTPKLMAHTVLLTLLLLHGHWFLTIFNIPMAIWLILQVTNIPRGNLGIYDPTEVHNRGQFKKHLRDCMINFVYYLLFFFIYLYCMIIALLEGDPIKRHEDDYVMEFL